MPNITRKRNGEYIKEIFILLRAKEDGLQVKDILSHLGNTLEMSQFELGYYPSAPNKPRYEKIVRFATIPLVKAGWLTKNRGRWYLTDEGKDADKEFSDPEDFYQEAVRIYQEWRTSRPIQESGIDAIIEDEPESFTLTFEEAEENAWEQIKLFLRSVGPYEFQDIVAELLEAMDYHVNWISPPGRDRGIDIIAFNDPLGTSVPRIKVQVKHRIDSTTNVDGLRAFMSILGAGDVGIFVSSGGFTKDAKVEARTQENRKITLLDLEAFFDLWIEHYSNLSQDARQSLPLKPIYYLAPDE